MAVGTSWIFLVTGEIISAPIGIQLMVDAQNMLNLEDVLAIFFIGLFGFLIDRFISYLSSLYLEDLVNKER